MRDPRAICIHCDGAMDYDTAKTGGNGYFIEFPDSFNLDPISKSLGSSGHGIHQIELISILEAIDALVSFYKKYSTPRCSFGVLIYTDRHSLPDLLNTYRIQVYRKKGWKNHEGKPIKDKEILDRIDKLRCKLSQVVGGRVEIHYKPRKLNKVADRLSKLGKQSGEKSKKVIRKRNRQVTKRLFDGSEVNYKLLKEGDEVNVRVYAWEQIEGQFEIFFEICAGSHLGKTAKAYVDSKVKDELHRSHYYLVYVEKVYKHHFSISTLKETEK